MAHGEDQAPTSFEDRVEAFEDYLDEEEQHEEEDSGDEPDEEPDDDQEEEDPQEESLDEEDEPEVPAIDPPVSWGADAKELFAKLDPELQKQVSEREAQRERFVQAKAQEAAHAKKAASMEVEPVIAQLQQQYANEIEQYAALINPQRPDPSILQTDPVRFYQMQAEFENASVQRQQMMQQAQYARQQSMERQQQVEAEQWRQESEILASQIPEWNDEVKRTEIIETLKTVGSELGYTADILDEATSVDVLALRKAAEWKEKASKYDALQKSKMEKVRNAKGMPKLVKPGTQPTRKEASSRRSQAAWQKVKSARSRSEQADSFAEYLDATGQ